MGDYGNLPVDIIFVRHGESEGNLAEEFSHAGDESYYEVLFVFIAGFWIHNLSIPSPTSSTLSLLLALLFVRIH